MKVWKMNGAGNAFAIFDARSTSFVPSTEQVRQIAEDLKADQIIALERDVARDVFMRIWNADGSEVSACGNASRCVGKLLLAETGKAQVSIQTEADVLKAFAAEDGQITVDMGSPLMGWEDIPLSEKMDVRGVDVKVGPLVEWHPTFPEGVNVGFAQVIDRQNIRLRVWERGAGLTKACGTGACAALVCAARAKLTDRRANLILDGGTLIIDWQESDDRVYMTGPVELEFETEI